MVPYSLNPKGTIELNNHSITSFIDENISNIDPKTVASFGSEWEKFSQFSEIEIENIGNEYFDICNDTHLNKSTLALDMGCGSGRWSKYLSKKVKFIEAIDPSTAVITAREFLSGNENVRVTQASADNIPFADSSFDFVFSLGVLHHIPDTRLALKNCISKVKSNGHLLIYLYYSLDNRGILYKSIFHLSSIFRFLISKLPDFLKKTTCDLIAFLVYIPLSRLGGFLKSIGLSSWHSVPLAYYHDKSINILRNDALDRFGTPLEQRFSKKQITEMLESEGMTNIAFSEKAPYWHVIAQKI